MQPDDARKAYISSVRERDTQLRVRDYASERSSDPRIIRDNRRIEPTSQFEPKPTATSFALVGGHLATLAPKIPFLASINAGLITYGVPLIAVVLIGSGIGLAVASVQNNIAVKDQVETYTQEASDSGETAAVLSTNPRHTRYVSIPSLSINTPTTQVTVNAKGNIGAPASIKNAAWYENSSSPVDSNGSALIVGHVGTDKYSGSFAPLHKITEGAEIVLTMGDNKKITYIVTSIADVNAATLDMTPYLRVDPSGGRVLHLITCAGDYNARTHDYANRLIVTAQETVNN